MNTESIDCRKRAFGQEADCGGLARPGDFTFDPLFRHINIWLPGVANPDALQIQRGNEPHGPRVWGWDGNEDMPTLTPSIHAPGQWHGYLTKGRLVSC